MAIILLFILSRAYAWILETSNPTSALTTIASLSQNPLITARQLTDSCDCPAVTRSLPNIIWSCLATIFLCTWVSVHPNLPAPKESQCWAVLRRLYIMSWALFAPEMILMWSVRQWRFARIAAKLYKGCYHLYVMNYTSISNDLYALGRNWTMTHGFLLVMGGFVLHRGDENLGVITYNRFIKLEQAGDIEFPTITREEIEDKSKGDGLSKAITLLQTIWFVTQCIARRAQGLSITELELATIALCSMSIATYIFWWYKPLNIKCPVRVYLKADSNYAYVSNLTRATTITDLEITNLVIGAALQDTERLSGDTETVSASVLYLTIANRLITSKPQRPEAEVKNTSFFATISRVGRIVWDSDFSGLFLVPGEIKSYVAHLHRYGGDNLFFSVALFPFKVAATVLFLFPIAIICGLFIMMVSLLWIFDGETIESEWADHEGITHLPTFYSPSDNDFGGEEDDSGLSTVLIFLVGTLFGGLHCIAWNFYFPTNVELIIWRVCSLIVCSMPTVLFIIGLFLAPDFNDTCENILGACFVTSILLYIAARSVLLVESFISLRNLPLDSLLDLNWSSFIPHLS